MESNVPDKVRSSKHKEKCFRMAVVRGSVSFLRKRFFKNFLIGIFLFA
jgi:hypothetical protein